MANGQTVMDVGIIKFDEEQFLKGMKKYLLTVMDEAVDECITIAQNELMIHRKSGTGKSKWWDMMREDVKQLNREIVNDMIDASVGQPYDDVAKQIIAMLTEQGHAGEIWTKPGEHVWDDEMRPKISTAKTAYRIPQFEQKGIHWMENVRKVLGESGGGRYFLIIENAIQRMPKTIYQNAITVEWEG